MSAGLRQPSGSARSGNFASSPPANISSVPWNKSPAKPVDEKIYRSMGDDELRMENQELQEQIDQLESVIANMEEDSMSQQQALLNQQNLTKQLENKVSDLEQQLLETSAGLFSDNEKGIEDLKAINQSLCAVQTEQDELIKDLQARLQSAQQEIVDNNVADLQAALQGKDDEVELLKKKVTQLHQQATDKVNRANTMLQERDAQIAELMTHRENMQDHGSLLHTIKNLEQQVETLEIELVNRENEDNFDGPVFVKSEAKKVQRSAAPRTVDPNWTQKLEAELMEAKKNLNDQQAEFEQLLGKQAEEMTAEFEKSLQKQASLLAEEEVKNILLTRVEVNPEEFAQLRSELKEKTVTCESLKRLIQQQDEVVAEQKKVLEAQASSASFAVENMQKMLREAQQRLKDDVVSLQAKDAEIAVLKKSVKSAVDDVQVAKMQQMLKDNLSSLQSKDAEIAALQESVQKLAEAEQWAHQSARDKANLEKQIADLRGHLDSSIKDNEGQIKQLDMLRKQLQALATEKDKEIKELKLASQNEIHHVRTEFRREYDALKAKNQQLIHDGETNMKHSWEQQDQIQRLSRDLEDHIHTLDMKGKTNAKLSADLRERQQALSNMRTKMDRMENVIMTQETLIQEANHSAEELRLKVFGLERAAQDDIHESEQSAFEELAMVKNRLYVLEGEYEAMKQMVENKKPDEQGEPIIRKQATKAQRSAPTPSVPLVSGASGQERLIASSDVRLAQLEMELQKEKERADTAEHSATQLKVDLLMYEEQYEDDWQEQLAVRKHQLMQEMNASKEACRQTEEQVRILQLELEEERAKNRENQSQADNEKLGLQVQVDMLNKSLEGPSQEEENDWKNNKILVLQLEEANGRCMDMQVRLDALFEKNMAVENKAREAEMEKRRAIDGQEKYTEEIQNLQNELVEEQKKVVQYENLVEKLQRSKRDLESEILVLTTDAKSRVQEISNLKEQNARLAEVFEQNKSSFTGLQQDLAELRKAKTVAENQMEEMFAKVTKLEEMLREVQSRRDALQEEKTKRDAVLRQTKDEYNLTRSARDELQEQVKLLQTEVLKAKKDASQYDFETKRLNEEVNNLQRSLSTKNKELQSISADVQSISADLQGRVNMLKDRDETIKELKGSVEKLNADLSNGAKKAQEVSETCEDLGEEVKKLNLHLEALKKEKQSLIDDAAQKEMKSSACVKALEEENKQALMKVNYMTAELTNIKTQLEVHEAENDALRQQVLVLQRRFEDAGRNASGQLSEKAAIEEKAHALEAEKDVILTSKRALEGRVKAFEEKERVWNTVEGNLSAESKKLADALAKANLELQKATDENVTWKEQGEALQSRAADDARKHANELRKFQDEVTDLKRKLNQDATQSTASQQAAYKREELVTQLESELKAVKRELSDAKLQIVAFENEAKTQLALLHESRTAQTSLSDQMRDVVMAKEQQENFAALQINRLTSEKASMETLVAELQELLEAKKVEYTSHDERLIAAEIEIQALTKEKMSKLVESAKMLAEVHAAKSESNNLTMRMHATAERLQDMKSQAHSLSEEQAQLRQKLEQVNQQNATLQEKLSAAQSEVERLSSGRTDVNSENVALSNELRLYKAENEKLSKIVKSAEASEILVQKLKQSWQEEKVNLESESRNMQAEHALLSSRLEAAQAAERELLQYKSKVTSEVEALRSDNEKLEAKVLSFKSKLDKQERASNSGDDPSELKKAREEIQDLLGQRQLMVDELAQRKMLLEAAMREAEVTMTGAEAAVKKKSDNIAKLMSENQKYLIELSMHKAEAEALMEDRTKLQRQVMALQADKETLQEKLQST